MARVDTAPLDVKVHLEITITEFDASTMTWLESLKDRACEEGEVTMFKITNLPSEMDIT